MRNGVVVDVVVVVVAVVVVAAAVIIISTVSAIAAITAVVAPAPALAALQTAVEYDHTFPNIIKTHLSPEIPLFTTIMYIRI